MRSTPDYRNECEACRHLIFDGEHMVGSVESGGLENFYCCARGHDVGYTKTCPEKDRCPYNCENHSECNGDRLFCQK